MNALHFHIRVLLGFHDLTDKKEKKKVKVMKQHFIGSVLIIEY